MPKTCLRIAAALLSLVLCAASGAGAEESEKEVVVEGYAFVDGMADAGVIEMAREHARRRAIEEGGQTTISRQSESENFELIRDVILTDTQGFLKSQEWILYPSGKDYEIRDDLLYVTLRAVVKVGSIENDLPAIAEVLRRRGQPRIAMVIREDDGTGESRGVVAAEIESLLIEKNFRMMDAGALEEISWREQDELFQTPDRASALLGRVNADYLILGEVRAVQGEPFKESGVEMSQGRITARFSVVDQHLGGKAAVVQETFQTRPALKPAVGGMIQTALESIGKNLSTELLAKLLDQLGRQTGFVEILLSNANRTRLDNLRESLLKMGGKQNFVTRSMRQGEAAVEFESQFNIDAIASYIELQTDAPLELSDQLESKLVCSFKGDGDGEAAGGGKPSLFDSLKSLF